MGRSRLAIKYLCLLFVLLMFSCKRKHEKLPEVIVEKTEPIDLQVNKFLKAVFEQYVTDSFIVIDKDTLLTSGWLLKFFSENNYDPVWTKDTNLLPIADSLLATIDSAAAFGLSTADYNPAILRSKISLISDSTQNKINITRISELNILLSDAYFRMATHLSKGRLDPDSLNRMWKGNDKDSSIVFSLNKAILLNRIRQSLSAFEPDQEQYLLLKSHLNDSLDSGDYKKIIVNMERWRWEQKYYDDYSIEVNLPAYLLKYYECDTLKLTSRIIVGKPDTQSPNRLNSKISYFYIYPYWEVPLSIATKEILPALQKDTSYFTKHHMDLMDAYGKVIDPSKIKWKKYTEKYFPFKIRQRDGDENTLGVLKFIFPNKFDIYLHDTNAKSLFSKEKRSLSHGCIRVKEARKLARKIVDCCVINFNADSLNTSLKNRERKRVNLFNKIPVHIRYFTAEADSEGVKFFEDIYGLDEKMMRNMGMKIDAVLQNDSISSEK